MTRSNCVAAVVSAVLICACGDDGDGGSMMDGGGESGRSAGTGGRASGGRGGSSATGGRASGGRDGGSGTGGRAGSQGGIDAGAARYELSVTVEANDGAEGTVTSTPAGIDCSSGTCTAMFDEDTVVSLSASSDNGSVLTGFSGSCSGVEACEVTLSADRSVTASFELVSVGSNTSGVAVTPDGAQAYVTLKNDPGEVRVVELSDFSVSATSIAVGNFPNAIAIAPDGSKALVTHGASLSVIVLPANTVTTINAPCAADTLYDVAISADSATAALSVLSGGCTQSLLATIDMASDVLTPGPNLNTGAVPQGVAITLDNASALVTLGVTGTMVKRVTFSGGSVADILDTSSSFGVAVLPGGHEALVTSGQADTVKRISLDSNTVSGSIDFESNQNWHNLAVTPDGSAAVVVGDFNTGLLSLEDDSVTRTWPVGGQAVAVTPDGKLALVTNGSTLRVFPLP